jgi:hypothetical protein
MICSSVNRLAFMSIPQRVMDSTHFCGGLTSLDLKGKCRRDHTFTSAVHGSGPGSTSLGFRSVNRHARVLRQSLLTPIMGRFDGCELSSTTGRGWSDGTPTHRYACVSRVLRGMSVILGEGAAHNRRAVSATAPWGRPEEAGSIRAADVSAGFEDGAGRQCRRGHRSGCRI